MESKIFVGNVPFQCTHGEFSSCFDKMQGFVKAEIIYKIGTNISRGFGFVTFDTPSNANELLNKTVMFKDRYLRFTPYYVPNENQEKQTTHVQIETSKNLMMVKNVENLSREEIYNFFSNFGQVGKHFIMTDHETGIKKNYAIVEIIDNEVYNCLLKMKEVTYGSEILEISKWKIKKYTRDKPITRNDLFNAFVAGKHMGMMEGIKRKLDINNVNSK